MGRKKLPSDAEHLAVSQRTEGKSNSADNHTAKLERFARAKARQRKMRAYLRHLWQVNPAGLRMGNVSLQRAQKASAGLNSCAEYLVYRHYWTVDEMRLTRVQTCQQFLLCPFCAMRRAAKMTAAYLARYELLRAAEPSWRAYMVTLTVKDGENLLERLEHLQRAHKLLQARRRKGQNSLWSRVHAAVGAYEVTKGKGSGLWHPHVHMVVFADEMPIERDSAGRWRCPELEREWEAITTDSKVVDVRPFNSQGDSVESFAEVFKYALKFSSLSLADNWEAAQLLRRRRLTFSYGAFRGVNVPEELTDEPLEGLPYVELFYRYLDGAGYSLESSKRVDLPSEASEGLRKGQEPVRRCAGHCGPRGARGAASVESAAGRPAPRARDNAPWRSPQESTANT